MKTNCVVRPGQLRRTDLRPAALLLGRAMRDNPVHVRAFAISDAERRGQALERFFRPVLLGLHQRGLIYGAYRDDALATLRSYRVRYYIVSESPGPSGFDKQRAGQCFLAEEPYETGHTALHLRSTFCGPPVADIVSQGVVNHIYDLNQ